MGRMELVNWVYGLLSFGNTHHQKNSWLKESSDVTVMRLTLLEL